MEQLPRRTLSKSRGAIQFPFRSKSSRIRTDILTSAFFFAALAHTSDPFCHHNIHHFSGTPRSPAVTTTPTACSAQFSFHQSLQDRQPLSFLPKKSALESNPARPPHPVHTRSLHVPRTRSFDLYRRSSSPSSLQLPKTHRSGPSAATNRPQRQLN